jgi:hypothetical protein
MYGVKIKEWDAGDGVMSFVFVLFIPVVLGGRWRATEEMGYVLQQ